MTGRILPRRGRAYVLRRVACGVTVLVAAAVWAVGCGESRPPVAIGGIPGLTIEVGNTESVDLTGYFSDADGDVLSYTATSSHSRVQVSVSGNAVQVTAVAAGTATVTVTAADPGDLSATQTFAVTVPNRAPEAVGQMPDAETFVGGSVQAALAGYFSDPDGDALAYEASSSDEGVATVSVTGATLRVAGAAQGVATVTVTATDPGGLSAEQELSVTVPNRGPEAVGEMPDAETFVGESIEVALAEFFSDPDGDALAYAAGSSDEGVATVGVRGATLRVAGVGQGVATVTVTATDPGGLPAEQEFAVKVPNRGPEAGDPIGDIEVFVGDEAEVDASDHFTDPDGDPLVYSASSSSPGNARVSISGSTVSVTAVSRGSADVTVTATDPGGLSATQTFEVTVPNRAPVAGDPIDDIEVFVGDGAEVDASDYFTDPDGDPLLYSASSSSPANARVAVSGSTVRVDAVSQGGATVTVTAKDPEGLAAMQTFEVTVPNRGPEAVGQMPDAETFVGESVEIALVRYFSDPDGDDLAYSTISSNAGVVTVTVADADLRVTGVGQGAAVVTVTVTDPYGLSATQVFVVTVPNRAPGAVGQMPDADTFVGESVEIALEGYFSEPDGDPLSYSAISSNAGVVTVTVSDADLRVTGVGQGTATVTVTATDPGTLSATQTFAVTVPNRAPEAVGQMPDDTTSVGESVEIALVRYFSDPDGDALAYAAGSSDEGVAAVGVADVTLRVASVGQGVATVTVTATDLGGLSAEQSFTVTVPNRAPEVSYPIPDAQVYVAESFELTLSDHFTDPDGDDLSYSAASSDEGVATASASGASLTAAGVGRGTATVTVTATDPGGLSVEQSFPVTVPNRMPEASYPIPDAQVYVAESFELTLSDHFTDPDGDDLSYSAASSDEGVATASASGASLTVAGVGRGTATVKVTATDPGGLTVEQSFPVAVPNRAPEVSDPIPATAVDVGDTVYVDLRGRFADPDGDDLDYSVSSSDDDLATVAISGDTIAVTGVAAGSTEVTVRASDGSLSATQTFVATIVRGEPTDREVLEILYHGTDGDNWTYNTNWLTDRPLDDWHGVGTDAGGRVDSLQLWVNGMAGELPPELGYLSNLRWLLIVGNDLLTGPVPPELGDLSNLEFLWLSHNNLTGPIPAELGALSNLERLWLYENDLSGPIPPELGDLSSLDYLDLKSNSLTGAIPPELGDLSNLRYLHLQYNGLTGPIPPELGVLSRLEELYLGNNQITGEIPPALGDLSNLEWLGLVDNQLTGDIPAELGGLSSLQYLNLSGNDLTGPIPPELGELSGLESLWMQDNARLMGELPSSFSNLTSLEDFYAHGTGVCVPETLVDWYRGIDNRRATLCAYTPADAYLVQAVQSREDPVPVVGDKEALLRVFVTAKRTTTETLPPATATFYVDAAETYSVEMDGTSEPIPTEIDEGSLDKSLNVTIPDSVIEEGLSVVIEIDPDSTIDAELLAAKRIPESGELDLGVQGVPGFELTAIPFLYTANPDSSVIETVEEMADDEEDHELLHDTYDLLPIEEMAVDDHDPVEIDSRSGYSVLYRTAAIRSAESGSGYWMGLMPWFSDVGGVAYVSGTSSASRTNASTIAHELGHNLSLWHAPCGGPARVDPDYPYEDGSIGAWGYDHRGDSLIDKNEAKDLMTYCSPEWVSDYHFTNAFRHRTAQEMSFGEARGRTGPSLLVWGSRSPSGELSMDPALLVEGRSLLPEAGGDYTLTGLDDAQRELFSISFDMDEPADAEEGTGIFVFLLPVEPGWEALASLVLAGPEDALFTLDGDTEATMALIRDARSGQVRAIRGDFAKRPPAPPGHVVRWSRGVPDGEAWRVMTGRGTGAGP